VVVSAREDHVQITLEDDGRGIGEENSVLVEVSEALRLYQGKLNIASRAGKGTRLALRLPIEMAVLDGMVVRAGSVRYVIPVNAIRRIVKTDATTLIHSSAEGNHYWLRLDRELIPIRTLVGDGQITNAQELVVVIEGEQHVVGLRVDELIGQQHVVVRPLEGAFAQIEDATGCALLGEGEVGVVLSRDLAVSQA
jgi:two-component system chemotaxis sensor kinase CheA